MGHPLKSETLLIKNDLIPIDPEMVKQEILFLAQVEPLLRRLQEAVIPSIGFFPQPLRAHSQKTLLYIM